MPMCSITKDSVFNSAAEAIVILVSVYGDVSSSFYNELKKLNLTAA